MNATKVLKSEEQIKKRVWTYVISIAVALGVGGLSALLTMGNMDLYSDVRQPPLAPPAILFPIVWTILYVLMGVAAGLVIRTGEPWNGWVMRRYYLQLGLNILWPMIFFRLELLTVALVWLAVLIAAILRTIQGFRRVSATAAWLLVPYLVWCFFALYLNAGFVILN